MRRELGRASRSFHWPLVLGSALVWACVACVACVAAEPGGASAADSQERGEVFRLLDALVRTRGVSGFEGPVRDAVLALLPAGVPTEVDRAGNLLVRIGAGPYRILFMAHLDELGFVVSGIDADGRLRLEARGAFLPNLLQGIPVLVETAKGPVQGVVACGERPAQDVAELRVELGTDSEEATRLLGVVAGQPVTPAKRLHRLAGPVVCGRALDDRAGCVAQVLAIRELAKAIPPGREALFVFSTGEETGLAGSVALHGRAKADVVVAIDTFVTSDSPVEGDRLAHARIGGGPVFRALDGSYVAQAEDTARLTAAAARAGVSLQLGVTGGANDASVWSNVGARTLAVGWPMRSSHSMVETIHLDDVAALARLVVEIARTYPQ
ncbi:MAG: M20/M25/M40 family metallo-hydrolase [Planctomycetes bacterium]|nr:M20/M25/M40 family metallo-hydrolase [Planctomycetota bacterium]